MPSLPRVLLVGGPDIDARLELMHSLRDRFDISALGSNPSLQDKFSCEGFRYYSYTLSRGVNILGDLKSFNQLISIIREVKPQIVHTFDTKPCVWGRLAARRARVPVVIGTLPGLGSLYVNNDIKTRAFRFFYQNLQRLSCHVSDLTIFQNYDDIRQFTQAGVVSTQKAGVILGSGINTNQFSPAKVTTIDKSNLKTEFEIRPDEIVVTMISRLIRTKGVFEFMESAREMNKTNSKVRYLLIGSEDRESLDRLSRDEMDRLKTTVDWRGHRCDIPAILAVSDVFVLPSIYREGIPRVLLEAAAMELPIITTDSPGCKEVVEDGINGFLVPAHDPVALGKAIQSLSEAPELRHRFGQVSRRKAVQLFDLEVISGQTRDYYDQFILNLSGRNP